MAKKSIFFPFLLVFVGFGSVTNETDPDSGSSQLFIRIWIKGNDTDQAGLWFQTRLHLFRISFLFFYFFKT